ncbi:hypothetical protein [Haloarchaeobius sp. DT45]|uniref:hypothetical protein n=1 Tax=Haloarchaeobius sp. DT45 TaxID=3446116 RepID=UPI003F6A5CF6
MRRNVASTKEAIARRGSHTLDLLGLAGLLLLTVLTAAAVLFVLLWFMPQYGLLLGIVAWIVVLGLAIGLPVLAVQYFGESLD